MTTSELIHKYFWLLRAFMSGPITKEEIDRRWERSSLNELQERSIPRTTFFRFRNELENLFGVEVKRCQQGYYIDTTGEQVTELQQWLLSSLSINNTLMECHSMHDRIYLESFPGGTQFLPTLVDAIQNTLCVTVLYASFRHEPRTFTFTPFALRVFKQRWYMIGQSSDHPGSTRVYALDRVRSMQTTAEHFEYPESFDVKEFFFGYPGVTVGRGNLPERVRLKVYGAGVQYLRTLPLHDSQDEVETNDGYSIFEYFVAPEIEFQQDILARGSEIEVLEPLSFRTRIAEIIREQYEKYNR